MRRSKWMVAAFGLLLVFPVALAATVSLAPTQDGTLYETEIAFPDAASGAGPALITGVNNQTDPYRIVLAFDVAGNIPAGSTINSAELRLNLVHAVPAGIGSLPFSLHVLVADWGEGASDAGGPGSAGLGVPAIAPDATWDHTFFPGAFWATAGGDFVAAASATTGVPDGCTFGFGPDCGIYGWSSAATAGDVQGWLDSPATNFGWLLKSDDEVFFPSARLFPSREGQDFQNPGDAVPELVVDFTPPPVVPDVSARGVVMLTIGLLAALGFGLAVRVRG